VSTKKQPAVGKTAGGDWTERGGQPAQAHSTTQAPRAQQPSHGRIVGDVWRKSARKSEHMLWKPKPSWCVDLPDLERAEAAGVRWFEIRETEEGRVYRVALATFRLRGELFDRGHGQQVRLALGYFQTSGQPEPGGAVQLSLF